mgnify:CR=1 FL=1
MADDRGICFAAKGWEDFLYWLENDRVMLERLSRLISECQRTPLAGIGKPEPLRGSLSGWWSRRLSAEHRLIYRATEQGIHILRCRFHY